MNSLNSNVMRSRSGFSLVELMIVVAIIGILSSIAVPQFQKFIFKARQTEAKTGLSSLYTAEKAFYGEWSEYDSRFGAIGYMPEGKYFYSLGFVDTAVTSPNFVASGTAPTGAGLESNNIKYCKDATAAGKCTIMTSANAVPTGTVVAPASGVAPSFIGSAKATSLNPDGGDDSWTINESKILSNVAVAAAAPPAAAPPAAP